MEENLPRAIYQDQRIAEEFCNFRCEYCEGFCPSGYSLNKDENGNLTVPKEWYDKIDTLPIEAQRFFINGRKIENFYDIAYDVMNKTKQIVDADILKISGGEITTNKNLIEFVRNIHSKYLSIQILTNGMNLRKEDIKEYKSMKNVTFQVSLDGVTEKSNYAKSHSKFITEKVLENIKSMLDEGLGVEVNCVLTKYNTDKFLEFLKEFKNATNFIIFPRPVRGGAKETIGFSKEQVLEFEKTIMENFQEYKNILPPKEYLYRLIEIMKNDKRDSACYIPFFVLSIDGYGNFEKCPIGLLYSSQKNILNQTVNKDEILIKSEYQVMNQYLLCKYCIVQYEMFNLYVEGKITKEELKKMPSLNSDTIVSHIEEIKHNILIGEIKKQLEERYLIQVDKIEKNEESTDGNVYIVYFGNKRCVVKLYKTEEHTNAMIKLHSSLINSGLSVPKIICTKENEKYIMLTNENYIVVYSFLQGSPIGYDKNSGKLDTNTISSLAKTLRKVHAVTEGENKNCLPQIPFKYDSSIERCSAIHFDLTRNNIFLNKENIEIIDFDDAKYGPAVCDVAITIANLFFSKTRGVDIDGTKKFIEYYYENELKLKNIEEPYIKEFAIKWIDYIMDGNEFDTSTTESFIIRKKLIEQNLL